MKILFPLFRLAPALAISLASFSSILSQELPLVKSISVRYVGTPLVSQQRVLSMMATKVGEPISKYRVDEDVKNLCESGEITNARILSDQVPGGLAVIVVVECRPLYGGVRFEGNTVYSDKRLSQTLEMKVDRPVDEVALRKARSEILQLYRKKGYPDAAVRYDFRPSQTTQRSLVYFLIDEKQPGVLRGVRFIGNKGLTAEQLRGAMKQKERGIQNLVAQGGRTDAESVAADARAIEKLYRDNGYFDAKVVRVAKIPVDSTRDDLEFTIQEGRVYQISEITINGINILSTDRDVKPFMKSQVGKPYSATALNEDIQMITQQYQSRGYIDARVVPRLDDPE